MEHLEALRFSVYALVNFLSGRSGPNLQRGRSLGTAFFTGALKYQSAAIQRVRVLNLIRDLVPAVQPSMLRTSLSGASTIQR